MYSLYIVWYIFLAGMGSGAYAIASLFGFAGRFSGRRHIQEYGRLAEGGFILGPILVVIGTVFLLFDLGSPEKAYLALLSPHITVLSVGVWFIVLFSVASGALLLNRLRPQTPFPRIAETALQVLAFLLSIGVMTYTGVFLASMQSVPFHHNWLLVALFVLSSLSTGAATIALFGFLNQHRKAMLYSLHLIPKIDLALIAAEVVALGAFLYTAGIGDEVAQHSLQVLLCGDMAPLFWAGAVGAGLALPLFLAWLNLRGPQTSLTALGSVLIVVGGFALRYCIIDAGIHVAQNTLLAG